MISKSFRSKPQLIFFLTALVLWTYGMRLWGLKGDLPLGPGLDEGPRISNAIRMAAERELDPTYFNHPSSTVIYPLAAIYFGWNAIFYGDSERALMERYTANPTQFFMLGRLLTVAFASLSVPLVYHLGRRAFDRRVGLWGAWLATLPLILKSFSQIARDDIAATFFGLLALYFCLQLTWQPSRKLQVQTGLAIGLAIATRYFMALLGPVWGLSTLAGLAARTDFFSWQGQRRLVGHCLVGLLAMALTFSLTTPYLFLNFSEAVRDISSEQRIKHLGADGLTPAGNLAWYLAVALPAPNALTWPLWLLALVGVGRALMTWQVKPLLLAAFVVIFLGGISLPALHWQRWAIPTLPILALFAAAGLTWLADRLRAGRGLRLVLVVLVSAWPLYTLLLDGIRLNNANSRQLARVWLLEHVPEDSKIAMEEYTAFMTGLEDHYRLTGTFSLATTDWTLDQAYEQGFRYVLVSSDIYRLFAAEPERYPTEISLYEQLYAQETLLQEIKPTYFQRGPTIRIYYLRER